MAEPTLKDVLQAIAGVAARVERMESRVGRIESTMATRADMNGQLERIESTMATRAEMNARFDRVEDQLKELDEDLDGHMKVHRELEKDIALLKGRPARTAARARRPRR